MNISTSDPLYYATLFGVNPALIASAKSLGISIQSSVGALKVHHNGSVVGTVSVKGSALTLAKNGNMGPSSKAVTKHHLEKILSEAVQELGGVAAPPKPIDTSAMTPGQKAAVTKAQKHVELADLISLTNVKIPIKAHKPAPNFSDSMKKLAQATKLYEAVAGSTSVYHVVALYPDLNIAMRRTPSKISLRAEGGGLSSNIGRLQALGFDDNDGYASVHLNVQTEELTQKTVGALFGLLGFAKATALGDPLKIQVTA